MTPTTCQRLGHSFKNKARHDKGNDWDAGKKGSTFRSRRHTNANGFTDKIDYRIEDGNTCQGFKISTVHVYPTSTDEKIEVDKKEAVQSAKRLKPGH